MIKSQFKKLIKECIDEILNENRGVIKDSLQDDQVISDIKNIVGSVSDKDNVYLSWRRRELDIRVLDVNYKTKYDTPAGIYAYPYSYINLLIRRGDDVPSFSEMPVILVIKNLNPETTLNLSDMEEEDYKNFIQKFISVFSKDTSRSEELTSLILRSKTTSRVKSYGGYIWNLTREFSERKPLEWRNTFLSLGITGVVDYGAGIIHKNEPTQAVFFTKKSVSVLGDIENTSTSLKSYDYDEDDNYGYDKDGYPIYDKDGYPIDDKD